MQDQQFVELTERSTEELEKIFPKAREVVYKQLNDMKDEGKVLMLTDEEERMLKSFRKFKEKCKPGAVFGWQTRPPEGVTLAEDTGLIQDPQDVSETPK